MRNFLNVTLAIILLSLLAGCGTQPSSGYIIPQQINDPALTLLPPTFEQQVERVNNCDGASPNYVVSYNTSELQNAAFEVVVGAGGLVTGTPVPAVLQIQLEAKITASLSKQFGINVERGHQLPLVIPNGKKIQHIITWQITRVMGVIDVLYDSGTAQVAFNKIATVALYDRQSDELPCNDNSLIQPSATAEQAMAIATPRTIETTPPPISSQPPQQTSQIVSQLDELFSSGNWFCFPDRGDAVATKKLKSVVIQSPLVKVDTFSGTYTSGKSPSGITATVWLDTWISQSDCPSFQADGLKAWAIADAADQSAFDAARMDVLFGKGNWRCISSFPSAVKISNLPANTVVQYPFTAVDNSYSKYGVGESVPQTGPATVWLAGTIAQSECP